MFSITPARECEITKVICPQCGERLPKVGLLKSSHIEGMTFRCGKCKKLWAVSSEPDRKEQKK